MLKTIAIFIGIYLIIWFFAYYLFPRVVKWYIRRVARRFTGQSGKKQKQYKRSKRNNNVKIMYDEKSQKDQIPDDIGEYVDFEEVKDKSRKK